MWEAQRFYIHWSGISICCQLPLHVFCLFLRINCVGKVRCSERMSTSYLSHLMAIYSILLYNYWPKHCVLQAGSCTYVGRIRSANMFRHRGAEVTIQMPCDWRIHASCKPQGSAITIQSLAISGTVLLEVPTIYKAYFLGLCKGVSPWNMAEDMVRTYLHFRLLEIFHWLSSESRMHINLHQSVLLLIPCQVMASR